MAQSAWSCLELVDLDEDDVVKEIAHLDLVQTLLSSSADVRKASLEGLLSLWLYCHYVEKMSHIESCWLILTTNSNQMPPYVHTINTRIEDDH